MPQCRKCFRLHTVAAARRQGVPRGQYHCQYCRHNHEYGSERGRECEARGRRVRRPPPAAPRPKPPAIRPPPVPPSPVGLFTPNSRPTSTGASQPSSPAPSARRAAAEQKLGNAHSRAKTDNLPWWRRGRRSHDLAPQPRRSVVKRRTARDRAKRSLAAEPSAIDTDLLTYVFYRDGFYERLADRLLDNLPWRRRGRRGHWLCTCLNDLAHSLDPGTYAEQVQKPTIKGMIILGFPKFIATVLGAAVGIGLKIALGHTPMGHLTSALRVLIPLVCPDLDRCPTKPEVTKTFATPGLAECLKEMADPRGTQFSPA